MPAQPKPFQQATAQAALAVLRSSEGPRRYLVADEPGLGKTVVAQAIIDAYGANWNRYCRTRVIYYITNNLSVARQNAERLVSDLAAKHARNERELVSTADRLAMLTTVERVDGPVELFAITPGTSFSLSRRLPRMAERAFLLAVFEEALPEVAKGLGPTLFRGKTLPARWSGLMKTARSQVQGADYRFVNAVASCFKHEFSQEVGDMLNSLRTMKPNVLLGRFRRVVALASVSSHPPDLVVLDEFQNYRELLDAIRNGDMLARMVLAGNGKRRPGLLLLSGTPYPSTGTTAHRELFSLLGFLKDDPDFERSMSKLFEQRGQLIDAIVYAAGDPATQDRLATDARALADQIEEAMRKVMSRTERATYRAAIQSTDTKHYEAECEDVDLAAYAGLCKRCQPQHRSDALPYWRSVPYAAQALGRRYQATRHPARVPLTGPQLTKQKINRLQLPAKLAHPKLRRLLADDVAPPEALALPWVAPSLPWWELRGRWKTHSAPQKMLLFSRFKATPQSVAALTSYAVDATALHGGQRAYDKATQASRLQPGKRQMPLFAMFHPSPFLIRHTNPLSAAGHSLKDVRKAIKRQLLLALREIGVALLTKGPKRHTERHRPAWQVLAGIERKALIDRQVRRAWADLCIESTVAEMVGRWIAADVCTSITKAELDDLVDLALGAPGVVCGRALLRHDSSATEVPNLPSLVELSWLGLRIYLDEPVFTARCKKRATMEGIQTLMLDGCFESVLDEHFWARRPHLGPSAKALASDLTASLRIKAGSFTYQIIGGDGGVEDTGIRLRCHAAVPFNGTDQEREKVDAQGRMVRKSGARKEAIQASFNTPFWPHMVVSTSEGQEGLDFHIWCHRVGHWDMCSSPIALEQREGRVNRYAGLAVRRQLAQLLGTQVLAASDGTSPWDRLAELADQLYGSTDKTGGLAPWWQVDGAATERSFFAMESSREKLRFEELKAQRRLYRLALGQPNPEDLVQRLAAQDRFTMKLLATLMLDLSAYQPSRASDGKAA